MLFKVLYFASLRERFSVSEEEIEMAEGSKGSDLLAHLRGRGAEWDELLRDSGSVRIAVNQEFAEESLVLRDGDEVALFPPVTGG